MTWQALLAKYDILHGFYTGLLFLCLSDDKLKIKDIFHIM